MKRAASPVLVLQAAEVLVDGDWLRIEQHHLQPDGFRRFDTGVASLYIHHSRADLVRLVAPGPVREEGEFILLASFEPSDEQRMRLVDSRGGCRCFISPISPPCHACTEPITEAEWLDLTDGWIPWAGGECPVEPGVRVEVRFPAGSISSPTRAESLSWRETDPSYDCMIVAYRVVGA